MFGKSQRIGINSIAALHRFVFDLDANREFLCDKLDFEEIAVSSPELEDRTHQKSAIFRAGKCMLVCSEPLSDLAPSARYLKKHPEGIGAMSFEVENIETAYRVLSGRGATPIDVIQRYRHDGGEIGIFSIATPLDDVRYHMVERNSHLAPLPGFITHEKPQGGSNKFGFQLYDHVTANFQTIAPVVLWYEHVLGFSYDWEIEFHTSDLAAASSRSSGLRSIVMGDRFSGIKLANNEPYLPNFENSQVNIFCDDQRGNGIQHAALRVENIVSVVEELREKGVRFVHTPSSYFENIDEHLQRAGVEEIEEDMEVLKKNEILVDGSGARKYLLQIFMEDAARFQGDAKSSPFFFELIERKGCPGFGSGNFRALFEGVERAQEDRGSSSNPS
jgi:4-hydroxyphenylpyruvate dioxygenase